MCEEGGAVIADVRTLLRAHYAFQTCCFLSESKEQRCGTFAFSEFAAVPMWNHATWVSGSDEDFAAFLREANEWHESRERRPVVYLLDPSEAAAGRVRENGYERFDHESWLLTDRPGQLSDRIRECSVMSDAFLEVFGACFSQEEGYCRALRKSSGHARHFVLQAGGAPVAIGTLIHNEHLACLYNVGTIPSARQQGFANEIVQHLLAIAGQSGARRVFLQVETDTPAHRLYRNLGFRTAFTRTGFRLAKRPGSQLASNRLAQIFAFARPAQLRGHIGRESRAVPAELVEKLERVFPNLPCATVYIAAWAYVLHRYTGDEQVCMAVREGGLSTTRSIEVEIDSSAVASEWVRRINTSGVSLSTAADSLLCVGGGSRGQLAKLEYPVECYLSANKLELCYDEAVYSKDLVRRIATHYLTALNSLAISSGAPVRELEILPENERQQILVGWNESAFIPVDATIPKLFEEQVERSPDATALVLATKSGEQLTYRQLNRRANRLAHRLQELGVRAEVPVAALLNRSLDAIVVLLAVAKAGGVFVPLDPDSPLERIRNLLAETEARVVITSRARAQNLTLPKGAAIIYVDDGFERLTSKEKNPIANISPKDAAYIIFTSGSTGNPKGVVVSHSALANHAIDCCRAYGLSAKDRVLQFSAFHFDASLEQILVPLISGATLVMRGDEVWTPAELTQKLRDYQLTVMDLPTAYWQELPEYWMTSPQSVSSHCLRLMIVGGEALSREKLRQWQKTPLATVRLINAYGPTETTITATSCELNARQIDSISTSVPIGRPRGDRKAYVLDKLGRPVPIGVPAELHIGGTLLSRGYYKQPRLTAASFIPNPFSDDPNARLYKTGDLVRYTDDGTLEFIGRIDDQVKVRGFRIEPGEIAAVLRKHHSVRDAIVLPEARGDTKRLIGYVLSTGAAERELLAHLRQNLPDYMIPARLVLLNEWPLTSSGKIDRRALPQPPEASVESSNPRGPRHPLELQLQLIFERVLKAAPIGIDENFFARGGDSLQALELLVQIEAETGKELPLGTLYQASTIEALARELAGRTAPEKWSSLVPLQARGNRPPLFLLHTTPGDILAYGNLVYRLGPDQPCYGFQSLGLKDAHLSHTSIEEMARYYVDLLRRFQPHGPYYLSGWCYGGIVAVEMARLLQAQGQAIGLLALLETVAMPPRFSNLRYYTHRARALVGMTPAHWLVYAREKWKYHRNARLANRMRFRQVDCPSASERDRLLQLEHVYNTNLTALNKFKSRYYDGTVTLFNAAQADPALIPDRQYGWVGLAKQIQVHEVPGDHDTMLAEPNVSVLAQRLAVSLARAQEGGGKR